MSSFDPPIAVSIATPLAIRNPPFSLSEVETKPPPPISSFSVAARRSILARLLPTYRMVSLPPVSQMVLKPAFVRRSSPNV